MSESPLIGTWHVETSGGLTECLFPLDHKILIQESEVEHGMLDVILVDGDRLLRMGVVATDGGDVGDGLLTLKLSVRVLNEELGILAMRTSAEKTTAALEESPVGNWTAEEGGGGTVDPV